MPSKLDKNDEAARDLGCYFDEAQADRAVRFIEAYYIPSTTGKVVNLLGWQRDFVRRFYGWRTSDNRRRFRRAVISTGKKNGKNLIGSAIQLYELIGNVQPSPFVVSASTTRENAGQIYREIAYSIRHNEKLNKLCKCLDSGKEVRVKTLNSRYKAFSADAGSSEGENISALIVDELHAHQSDKLYRALEYSTVARPDSFSLIISTAGADQSSLWFELFRYAQAVQRGDTVDTTLLPAIYTADPEADPSDPATWRQANPSLGKSFTEEDFKKDYTRATAEGTAALLSFYRYRLNRWVASDKAYMSGPEWDACSGTIPEDELKNAPLIVACDLSQTIDPCSVSCVWALPDRKFYVRNHSWVCEEGVRRRDQTLLPRYQSYASDGTLTISKGKANDYRSIHNYILDLRERYNLRKVVWDRYNAVEMTTTLEQEGIKCEAFPQNHRFFNSPVKELEIAVREQRVTVEPNAMLRWAMLNCILDVDSWGNAKPDKGKSTDKIDPCVSLLMALSQAVLENPVSVYSERGFLTF